VYHDWTSKRKLPNRNILISGASAAGPSLAYWLHHYGFNPTVIERAPALRAGGYAIDLRGTAVHVAERMGILAEARKVSTDLREVWFVDSKNETLATMDANLGAGPGKAGDVELLRDDLAQILYAATKDKIDYIFGDSIASLSQHDQGVEVTFKRSAPRTFDLVVGADGSHSNVRSLSFGEESRFSHYLGYHVAIFTIRNFLNLDRLWLFHYVPKKNGRHHAIRHRQAYASLIDVLLAEAALRPSRRGTAEEHRKQDVRGGHGMGVPPAARGNAECARLLLR